MSVKKRIIAFVRSCINKDYRNFRSTDIFDSSYYLSLRGKSLLDDLNPLWTDLRIGKDKGKVSQNVVSDWSQQPDPHPFFDASFYLLQYFPEGLDEAPFIHYLRTGWKSGFWPGPFFDPENYALWSGWAPADGDPLSHYCQYCQQQGKSPGLSFDFEFYSDKNPNLSGFEHELIKHYKLHGASGGKSPIPLFDPTFYLGQLQGDDVVYDPLSHYLSTAHSATLYPSKLFDPDFYIDQCDMDVSRRNALTHYVTSGVFEGVYCHPRVASLTSVPVISILVPVYNPDPAVLRNCIRSVLYQAYPHWELCLVDDCSPRDDVRPLLQEWAEKDSRIKVAFHSENGGIATATNSASALATGSYVGFLDNDDELTPDCLLEVVEAITSKDADMVYSDEDLIGDDGTTLSVFRKPGFNPSLLLSHNYITHFVAVKRSLFDKVGGLDCRYDGAQDYDFMLKLAEACDTVVHIPKVLYHWRATESSTSINHDQKSYANEAGRLALDMALKRRQTHFKATDTELNFFYRLQASSVKGRYAVFIWAKDVEELSPGFIASIDCGDDGVIIDVTLIVSGDRSEKIREALNVPETEGWNIVPVTSNEGKAEVLQRLVINSRCEFACFLDGSIQKLSDNWLSELGTMSAIPDVAIVSGRIRYSGGDGVSYLLPDLKNKSAAYLQEFLSNSSRHMAGLHCMQDMSFAGWDMSLIRKDIFEAVDGFAAAEYPSFAMAELSLRLTNAGKKIVYTPFAIADKGDENDINTEDEADSLQQEKLRFQRLLKERDYNLLPYYNNGLLADHGIEETDFLDWLLGE